MNHPHNQDERRALERIISGDEVRALPAVEMITNKGYPAALVALKELDAEGEEVERVYMLTVERMGGQVRVRPRSDDKETI